MKAASNTQMTRLEVLIHLRLRIFLGEREPVSYSGKDYLYSYGCKNHC